MIAFVVVVICATVLTLQYFDHKHTREMGMDQFEFRHLLERVDALELARSSQYDPAAFDELKSKVETLRLAQGMRVGR